MRRVPPVQPDLRDQALLAHATQIDPAGRVFMGAHVRIGASAAGRINPRLYFHDATARFGMMYVGYLGRHLSNTRS